jgi:hypothetical protein
MSYCRFRNTLKDFEDCTNALQHYMYDDLDDDVISDEELRAAEQLVRLSFEIVDELGFVTSDGEFDYEECKIFFERLKDGCQ